MDDTHVIWDTDDDLRGNVHHILEHGISKDEVHDVLLSRTNSIIQSRESDNLITFGYTEGGRYLGVVWEHVLDDPLTMRPLTAFDAPEPQRSAFIKRKKR